MSLKKNIIANYISQIYVTMIGIVMVPLYISYMGPEAYGLVGFFAMLQAWFNLLDLGLTPTVARETARFDREVGSALEYRRLIRALEGVFLSVALLGAGGLLLAAEYFSEQWLNANVLEQSEVAQSVKLMAVIVAIRWASGLYRGVITGAQRLVWLSGFNASIASLRFVGVLPVLIFIGATPALFFAFQLGVALLEFALLIVYSYRLLPKIDSLAGPAWSWSPLKPVLKFSLSVAFTSSVWVFVTQVDKLILSKLLSLADFGYFTLAVMAASGVLLLSGPISTAIMPRMANLEAHGDHLGLIAVYRQATKLVALLAGSAAVTIAFCAEPLLWVWTGDRGLAQSAAPVLALYALGNGILAVSAFPYFLQYAKGDLRLHLIGNAIFVVLLIPFVTIAAKEYGALGAGWVWLCMNFITFVAWLPLVHRKFEPGLNLRWYGQDILSIVIPAAISGYLVSEIALFESSRKVEFGLVCLVGFCVLSVGGVASKLIGGTVGNSWKWLKV